MMKLEINSVCLIYILLDHSTVKEIVGGSEKCNTMCSLCPTTLGDIVLLVSHIMRSSYDKQASEPLC
jgi:hypothetical protein